MQQIITNCVIAAITIAAGLLLGHWVWENLRNRRVARANRFTADYGLGMVIYKTGCCYVTDIELHVKDPKGRLSTRILEGIHTSLKVLPLKVVNKTRVNGVDLIIRISQFDKTANPEVKITPVVDGAHLMNSSVKIIATIVNGI